MDNLPSIYGRFDTKFAKIESADASAGIIIVPAVAGKKIRLIAYHLAVAAAMGVNWESGVGGTHLTGVITLAANGGISADCLAGICETLEGEALALDTSAIGVVGGSVSYIELD